MKILLLTNEFAPYRGGIATYVVNLALAAYELGQTITVVAPDYGGTHGEKDSRTFPFRVIRYAGGINRPWQQPGKAMLVSRLLKKEHYDVVHAADWPFYIPIALAARHYPRICTLHGSEILSMSKQPKRGALTLSRAFNGDVRWVANSRFTANLFSTHFPTVDLKKVSSELLGVGKEWFCHREARDEARRRFSIPLDGIHIITIARLTRRKGHLNLFKAFHLLPEVYRQKISYTIIGSGMDSGYVEEITSEMSNSSIPVQILSGLGDEDVRDICAASDLFCLPGALSKEDVVEGFGLALLEAAALGVPAIAGSVGGVAEVVDDGVSGLVVPVDDVSALANAVRYLVENPRELDRLGRGARSRAETLTWHRCAQATYQLGVAGS